MGQSLGAYRAAVRAALGEIPTSALTADVLDQEINASYFEVLELFEHPELQRDTTFATVSGTKEYALPSDYWWMRYVRDETNDETLLNRSLAFIRQDEDGATGTPEYWVHEDENLMLHETPNGVFTIREWYVFRPAVLADADDKDVLGAEWTEIIRKGAIYRAFETVGELDRGVHWWNRQRALLNRKFEIPARERTTSPGNIGAENPRRQYHVTR